MMLWDSHRPKLPPRPCKILNICFSATLAFLRKIAGLNRFCPRYGMPVNHFWAQGYCVGTVGLDEDMIRKYVKWQEKQERRQEELQFSK